MCAHNLANCKMTSTKPHVELGGKIVLLRPKKGLMNIISRVQVTNCPVIQLATSAVDRHLLISVTNLEYIQIYALHSIVPHCGTQM